MTRRIVSCLSLACLATLVPCRPAASQATDEERARLEAHWRGCGFGLELKKGFTTLAADRKLTPKQKDCILRVGDILLHKDWDWSQRVRAADWLGDMGHAYCIAPLLAVFRDDEDNSEVRVQCVLALAHIADKRVVDPLIDAITDRDGNVAGNAYRQLD